MALVIFGDSFTFPEGNAATNHVYTYALGFMENGINVHVICFESSYLEDQDGVVHGIQYYHPFSQTKRSKYFVVRRWQNMLKYIRAFRLLKRIDKNDRIIVLNLWSYLFATQLYAFFLARWFRTKLIAERSEHPMRYYKEGCAVQQFYGKIRVGIEILLYDGIFCISKYLIEFYKVRGFNERKLFLVPSTVDTGRFGTQHSSQLPFKYILYCGTLTIKKDGIDILIAAFNKICEKYPFINLVLIGKGETFNNDEEILRDIVKNRKLEKRVIFLGQLSRTVVPAYLSNALTLTLARPRSIVADAGFPSKLTEYLATGMPVVVTAVGEIPFYLKDNENAFIVEPDSIDAFASKLDYVLTNYEYALSVGKKGQELTRTVFNYNYQAKRMLGFIKSF